MYGAALSTILDLFVYKKNYLCPSTKVSYQDPEGMPREQNPGDEGPNRWVL